MGQVTMLILAFVSFVALAEGVCNGYYYKSCHKHTYQKEAYSEKCGWWGRCSKYRQKRKSVYYQCSQRCPTVHGGYGSWGSWSSWGGCTKYCGGGSQTGYRRRSCNRPTPQNGGRNCYGSSSQSGRRSCNTQTCIINGGWGSWGTWSSYRQCTRTCGSGVQSRTRSRSCNRPVPRYGGSNCPGSSSSSSQRLCNTRVCPVKGGWGSWGTWSSYRQCTKTCGSGVQSRTRSRSCNRPVPGYGGSNCPDSSSSSSQRICNTRACPVDGGWTSFTAWSKWTKCSESCGNGIQKSTRSKSCTNPTPKFNGKQCSGAATEERSQPCKLKECPVDGGWTEYIEWSKWTECSESCGDGSQKSTRSRSCTNPEPKFNGLPCAGEVTEERSQICKIKDCPAYCECSTVGDTHYKTFDGEWIHFMGSCKFELAKSQSATTCPFSVVITNKAASETAQLPYKRTIDFTVKDYKISLLQNKNILVDGAKVHLPYSSSDKTFDIFISGRYARVQTNCGIIIEWDGAMNMELAVLDTYAKQMTGMCGDCDGLKNDLKKKDGTDVKDDNNKFSMIGASFTLKEAGITCSAITEVPEVSDEEATIASSVEYCGHLVMKENGTSPFQKCLETKDISPDEQYNMCVTDVSLYYGKHINDLEKAVCNNLGSFALQCEEKDVTVDWRNDELCPLKCGTNQIYSDHVSGCQANCVIPDGEKSCHLPFTEGCACKDGFILSGIVCVKVEDCGCSSKIGYIALGEEVVSADCKVTYKCVMSNGTAKVTEEASENCHDNAVCQHNADGESLCKCKEGFEGDGIIECKSEVKDCKHTKSGSTYKGKISKTASGIVCQEWAKSKPHGHSFTTRLAGDSNHCRNPDGSDKPWCYTVNEKTRWQYCSVPDCEIKDCRTDSKGTTYNGQKNTTKSGIVCQAWGTSTPHKHSFGKLADEKNYCRNPDGENKPWCYTIDSKKRWDYCDIPRCATEDAANIKQCLTETKGRDYNGHKNTTKSGLTCQAWGSNTPHTHIFGSLEYSLNNCRNPDGSGRPWCYTIDPTKRWEYCDIPMCYAANIKQCLTETKGSNYNGHKNTTTSGLTCQAWGSNTPHKHIFGSLEYSLNNCRNPDGSGRPWCYTIDPTKRWEYCDIPMC